MYEYAILQRALSMYSSAVRTTVHVRARTVFPAESPLPETFGFSEMSAVARFGTSEISVQARFRVRTFFRCAQVKNFFGLECPVSMVVVQPQDLSNWHAKGLKKYLLPQQALFCGNAGHTVW